MVQEPTTRLVFRTYSMMKSLIVWHMWTSLYGRLRMRFSYSGCELSIAAVALEISLRPLAALGQPTLSDVFLATVRLCSAGGQASKADLCPVLAGVLVSITKVV